MFASSTAFATLASKRSALDVALRKELSEKVGKMFEHAANRNRERERVRCAWKRRVVHQDNVMCAQKKKSHEHYVTYLYLD